MLSVEKLRKLQFANWSMNELASDFGFYEPTSIEEVATILQAVNEEKKTIRTVGAAHSFSPIAKPEHYAMSLHRLRGLIALDKKTGQATFWAGTYLHEVGPILAAYGLALENMGDIAEQTIAGAISTGTHGTGLKLRSISNQVVKWSIIDGTGKYVEINRGNDAVSEALHISLGLLGIIVQVTLQTVPLYALRYKSQHITVQETLDFGRMIMQQHRHAEWFYFPGQEKMQLKTMDLIAKPYKKQTFYQRWGDDFLENDLLQLLSESCRFMPSLTKHMSKLAAAGVPTGMKEAYSYEIFPSPRKVKFLEMEYAIKLEKFEVVMEELHYVLKSNPFAVHFPIEIRVAAGESGFLSPTQNQYVVFFAFHMYKGMPHADYFRWAHRLMEKYGARPHLGKMNQLTRADLLSKYPNFTKFLKIRQQFDPQEIFATPYFQRLFT